MRGRALWPTVVLIGLFIALTLPLAGSERVGASESFDERAHHLPLIVTFAVQWPVFNVASYNAAMTPGYHIAMAAVYRLSGRSVTAVRIANGAVALALAVVVFRLTQTLVTSWTALVLTLPLVASPYFLGSAIWLTTDNAALLLVSVVLGDVLRHRATSPRTLWRGMVAAAAVLVRQVSVWIVAPVALSALTEWRLRDRASFTPGW
jgi:4-amino-4-deoxy-L-arabinose transferase-like glycosyltransferase